MNFQIYLCELIPFKIKQGNEKFSAEQGYILTRCMFDIFG